MTEITFNEEKNQYEDNDSNISTVKFWGTKERALEAHETLQHCFGCKNCEYMEYCDWCEECTDCTNSERLEKCHNCDNNIGLSDYTPLINCRTCGGKI